MIHIEDNVSGVDILRIGVAVCANALCGGKLGADSVIIECHGIVAGTGHFGVMAEA